jgi:hypothetical protein
MGVKRAFAIGFLSCFMLFGCAGAAFSYRYYGLGGVSYSNGTLRGPKETDDVPFATCEPNSKTKNPCVLMLTKDFFAFKQDYEDTKQRLNECERR